MGSADRAAGVPPVGRPRPNAVERRGNVAPEPRRVVLAGIQRQPCCGVATLASVVPEQRRLAEPGWGAHHGEPATYRPGKTPEQARTGHDARSGDVELRGQEILALRGASGWVRRDGLSHRLVVFTAWIQADRADAGIRLVDAQRALARLCHHEPWTLRQSTGAHRRRGSTAARGPSCGAA